LKEPRLGADTTESGSLFQPGIVQYNEATCVHNQSDEYIMHDV